MQVNVGMIFIGPNLEEMAIVETERTSNNSYLSLLPRDILKFVLPTFLSRMVVLPSEIKVKFIDSPLQKQQEKPSSASAATPVSTASAMGAIFNRSVAFISHPIANLKQAYAVEPVNLNQVYDKVTLAIRDLNALYDHLEQLQIPSISKSFAQWKSAVLDTSPEPRQLFDMEACARDCKLIVKETHYFVSEILNKYDEFLDEFRYFERIREYGGIFTEAQLVEAANGLVLPFNFLVRLNTLESHLVILNSLKTIDYRDYVDCYKALNSVCRAQKLLNTTELEKWIELHPRGRS